jgi:hypothetical protein
MCLSIVAIGPGMCLLGVGALCRIASALMAKRTW